MKKTCPVIILLSLFFIFARSCSASLIIIDNQGKVISKVLGANSAQLDLNKVTNNDSPQLVVLANADGKTNLTIGGESSWDVTNWQEDLIEVEERGETAKLNIFLKDGLFNLQQGTILATTDFPISIDPQLNKIMLKTATGEKYLKILPLEAIKSALRAKTMTEVNGLPLTISEDNKDLCYLISGQKSLNLFNLYTYNMDISTKISASTGEVISSNEPVWMKIISLLLTTYS